jgi:type II secretory pathway component GspD/PulD (secretin)
LVTTNKDDSEGIDLNAFASFASGKFGFVVQNNALGGLTLSTAAGALASLTAPNQPVGGALVGATYNNGRNALQIFNAFLSEQGNVSVVQRPLITTTSGVPGIFSKKFTDYYNTISQEAVAGSTGAPVTATRNNLIPVDFGTELRINPRIDVSTGLIRAQLTLNQALQSGTKTIQQTITAGNNSVTVPTAIPIVTRQNLSGEILLRDGDLVVVGGQSEDSGTTNANGLPGQNGPVGAGIFGVKQTTQTKQTYYFALRVSVNKRK